MVVLYQTQILHMTWVAHTNSGVMFILDQDRFMLTVKKLLKTIVEQLQLKQTKTKTYVLKQQAQVLHK